MPKDANDQAGSADELSEESEDQDYEIEAKPVLTIRARQNGKRIQQEEPEGSNIDSTFDNDEAVTPKTTAKSTQRSMSISSSIDCTFFASTREISHCLAEETSMPKTLGTIAI